MCLSEQEEQKNDLNKKDIEWLWTKSSDIVFLSEPYIKQWWVYKGH